MDLEFHYYINYLIALKAGFSPLDAFKIAYSAQFVDDNLNLLWIGKHPTFYKNTLSQTYNISLPRAKLYKIYLCHHFIPGDLNKISARQDGRTHPLITTPNSSLAQKALKYAFASKNLYLIGIASHAYTDTWAHANFTGTFHALNAVSGFPENLIPNIGHADLFDKPDGIDFIWDDPRLVARAINNKFKFLDAAQNLLVNYRSIYLKQLISQKEIDGFIEDLSIAIWQPATKTRLQNSAKTRIKQYQNLARKYSGKEIPTYQPNLWLDMALKRISNIYQWRDTAVSKEYDWYLFQEAVKIYQIYLWKLILKRHSLDFYLN